jgi:hypothetical protein
LNYRDRQSRLRSGQDLRRLRRGDLLASSRDHLQGEVNLRSEGLTQGVQQIAQHTHEEQLAAGSRARPGLHWSRSEGDTGVAEGEKDFYGVALAPLGGSALSSAVE